MSFFNYQQYYDSVASRSYNKYVEVGCYEGDSISYLAKALRHRWRHVEIYAVDLFENITKDVDPIFYNHHEYWLRYEDKLKSEEVRNKVTDIRMHSVNAASLFKDRDVDFVFLDACKNYESVVADLEAWYPKISGYGMLAGHDCYQPSVDRALKFFTDKYGRTYNTHANDVWEIK
ncbi:class I SAM-dependent methyltransferase [bacterium]|nr:class I SAM-dependent methyltransferase [bacterium]